MNAITPADRFATDAARRDALRRRDPAADGAFLYSVATTGVYCRPSCAARPARPENVAFHATRADAERAGFRPCSRCRPDLPPRAEREAGWSPTPAARSRRPREPPPLAALAAAAGLSGPHFHRLFRRVAGVTPKAYADAQRQRRVRASLRDGVAVTTAMYDAGFNSSGRFYEAADGMLGMTPSAFRAGGAGEAIRYAIGHGALGAVLVAATARGICAILLGDDPAALLADLAARFPRARTAAGRPGFRAPGRASRRLRRRARRQRRLPAAARHPRHRLPAPRVGGAARHPAPATTLSYRELATRIGSPSAVRAVAGACAANALAVAVPCHRVVASDGAISGYRWGAARKRRLLEQERTS